MSEYSWPQTPEQHTKHMLMVTARYRRRTMRAPDGRQAVRLHPRKFPQAMTACLICGSDYLYADAVPSEQIITNSTFHCGRCFFPFYFSERP